MPYTAEEAAELVEQEDVECIRLAFFDALGHPKSLSIAPSQLWQAIAVPPVGERCDGLFLVPDLNTLQVLPWYPKESKTARMYCSIRKQNGAPFAMDCRYLLHCAQRSARDMGLSLTVDTAHEFYLLAADKGGRPANTPHDGAEALDAPPTDKGEDVRREICQMLKDMGITPVYACHWQGAGQHRITYCSAGPMEAADTAMTFREVVHIAAYRSRLHASFAPKPLVRQRGSGVSLRLSMGKAGRQCMGPFFAGVIRHMRDMTAFLNPVRQSYERLGEIRNETLCTWTSQGEIPYMELQSLDGTANPYIAFALLIYAGLEGIRRNLAPEREKTPYFPKTIEEAYQFTEGSDFIRDVLPAQVIQAYRQSVL